MKGVGGTGTPTPDDPLPAFDLLRWWEVRGWGWRGKNRVEHGTKEKKRGGGVLSRIHF